MQDQDDVTLTVDGKDFAGWKAVEITPGIERQSRDFNLAITWRWPGGENPVRITHGARCQIRIGGDVILTGYVYATPISYDSKQITLQVVGRSLTSDLVDCSAQRGQWRNQSVASIVTALAAPYGISVVDQSGDSTIVADHQVEPGETVFASIDRLLEISALLSTDDEHGRIVIAKPGSRGRAVDALVLGQNVLSASAPLDFSGVYSEYECVGQRAGTDDSYGEAASEVSARMSDPRVARYRLLTIQPSGQVSPAIAARRVLWERESRMARALATEYRVRGWRQSDGSLWRANTIVPVRDPLIGFDREMLISEITYSKGEGGTIARMSVAPAAAFEAEPKERKQKKGGSDSFEYLLPADWDSE